MAGEATIAPGIGKTDIGAAANLGGGTGVTEAAGNNGTSATGGGGVRDRIGNVAHNVGEAITGHRGDRSSTPPTSGYGEGTLGSLGADRKKGITQEAFGGESKKIETGALQEEFQESIAPILYRWAQAGLDVKGIRHGATKQDYMVYDMIHKLTGMQAGEINRNTLLGSSQLDILRLRPSEIDTLLHTLGSMDDAAMVAVGLIPKDGPSETPPKTAGEAFVRAMKNGGDRLSQAVTSTKRAGQFIVSAPLGNAGREWFDGLKTKEGREKALREMRARFANSPNAAHLNGLGVEEFVTTGLQGRILDGQGIYNEQMSFIHTLREGRRKIEVRLRGHATQTPSEAMRDPNVRRAANEILHQPEYKGQSWETLSDEQKWEVSFTARRRVIWEKDEQLMQEAYDRHFQHKSHGKLEQLGDRIAGLKGEAPTANAEQAKPLKEAFEKAQSEFEDQEVAFKTADSQLKATQKEQDVAEQKYNDAMQEYTRLTNTGDKKDQEAAGALHHTASENYNRATNGLPTRLAAAETAKNQAEALLVRRKKTRDDTEKKYEPFQKKSTGDTDKEKRALLETVEGLFDSTLHNKLVRLILDTHTLNLHDMAHNASAENYTILRKALGIDDKAFDAMVHGELESDGKPKSGQENAKLRKFLADALGYAQEGNTENDVFEEAIWERISTRTNAEFLENIADPLWDSVLTTAVTGEPTLKWSDSLRLKPEVAGEREAKVLGEEAAARMRDPLEQNGYQVGVNTLARYVELPGGNAVAIVVNEEGVNEVIDQNGTVIGSMERLSGDGKTVIPGTTAEAITLQETILSQLGQESLDIFSESVIRDTSIPAEVEVERGFTNPDGSQLTLSLSVGTDKKITVKKQTITPPGGAATATDINKTWEEYSPTIRKARGSSELRKLETDSKALRDREQSLGNIVVNKVWRTHEQSLGDDSAVPPTILSAEWTDETHSVNEYPNDPTLHWRVEGTLVFSDGTTTPINYPVPHNSQTDTVAFNIRCDKDRLEATQVIHHVANQSEQNMLRGSNIPISAVENYKSAPFSLDASVTSRSDGLEQRRQAFLESAFFRLQSLPQNERGKILASMQTINIGGVKGGAGRFDVGVENGRFVLWDRSDPAKLSPPSHDALTFLNEQYAKGQISLEDMRNVRVAIGLEYFHTIQRGLQ